MKIKTIGLWGTMLLASIGASAQTHVTFESEDYAAVGVYDTWEQSPFRTGQLAGNVAVTTNHLADEETNSSGKILGVQRSRFGSNTFGVRVDLKQTFELTADLQYAHVMIHKPVEGRVMLIGLGKRTDRAEQSREVEQFWVYPVNEVKVGEWCDAVFPIKGNGGIDIYSLVVVPHCEAPHTLDGDFVAYVDDILINDDMKPRVGASDYMLNFTADSDHGRPDDRWTSSVGLQGSSDGTQTINVPSEPSKKAYNALFDTPLKAKAGNTVTATFGYNSSWMHSYVYLDKGQDGEFSAVVDDNLNLDTSSDLVAYTLYSNGASTGKNSTGTSISNSNNGFSLPITPPAFTIPSNLQKGIYRMRYKIDWNSIDPAGDVNTFFENGGAIVDVLLNVHGDYCSVSQDNRNGEVTTADGTALNGYQAPFGQALKVKMVPSNGFEYNGIRVRHGYNLTGDSLVHGNPQYRDVVIYADEFDADDCVEIPAELMDGDVLIEGLFVEEGHGDGRVKVTYNVVSDGEVINSKTVKVTAGSAYPDPEFTSEVPSYYWELSAIPEGVCEADTTVELELINKLPFIPSKDYASAVWYNLTITSSYNYLTHTSGSYINLGSTTTTVPAETDLNSQWAFVGNVFDGFQIVNHGAGESKILSSSTNTSTNTGGATYPVMTTTPVPTGNNTYWIPSRSTNISGVEGFYLAQMGISANRLNSRDSKLAYWTGGADAGSTLTAIRIAGVEVTIENAVSNQGTVEVYAGSTKVASGSRVDEGTEITIVVTPEEYFFINEVTVNGEPLEAVDGEYKYVVGTSAVTIAVKFDRDPNAPIDYCVPTYGGNGTSRTTTSSDRHLDQIVVSDGVSSMTITTNGSTKPRAIYLDKTENVLTTETGKTITVTATGSVWAMHNFIYADFDYNGFGANDRVMYSENALGEFTFVVPEDLKPGEYRVRHMLDWNNDDPCKYSQTQSGDNGECIIDFVIKIEGSVLSVNISGEGEVEVWTGGDATTGPTGTKYADQSVIAKQGFSPVVVFKPAAGYRLTSLTYDNGDGVGRECSYTAIDASVEGYEGWYITPMLDANVGDASITAVFAEGLTGIDGIYFDPADGDIEFYNLQGIKVNNENLLPGIYIVRQGSRTKKVVVQ